MRHANASSSRRRFVTSAMGIFSALATWPWRTYGFGPQPLKRPTSLTPPFRRVVTGFNAAGKSTITSDGPVPPPARYAWSATVLAQRPYLARVSGNELWLLDRVPADLSKTDDPLLGKLPAGNQPGEGGIIARIVRYEPGLEYPMHTTQSIDLGIVVSGSLELRLEDGSTTVGPGDVVIQRGTPHAWRVAGDDPVVVVFVLVDAINGRGSRPAA